MSGHDVVERYGIVRPGGRVTFFQSAESGYPREFLGEVLVIKVWDIGSAATCGDVEMGFSSEFFLVDEVGNHVLGSGEVILFNGHVGEKVGELGGEKCVGNNASAFVGEVVVVPFIDYVRYLFSFRMYGGNIGRELGAGDLDRDASEDKGLSGDAYVIWFETEMVE